MAANLNPKTSKSELSARDRFRRRTNYETARYTGWAPIPFAAIAEIPRLSSGAACQQLLYVILALSVGEPIKGNGQPFHESTPEIRLSDLVDLCYCDERTVQRELLALQQRGVIQVQKGGKKGFYILTPLFRTWASLGDYKPGPTIEPPPDDDEDEDEDEPAAAKQNTVTKLTDKPVPVRAGSSSRKIRVDCGISEIWCKSNLDIHFEAVVQSGCLLVNFIGPQFQRNTGNGSLKRNGLPDSPRHARRVEHPRAGELVKLFDDLLTHGSLDGDPVCLSECCNAVGSIPHDDLIKYVIQRAEREIKSPKAAVCICRDALRDWERAKTRPPQKRDPRNITTEEYDTMIAQAKEREREMKRRQA